MTSDAGTLLYLPGSRGLDSRGTGSSPRPIVPARLSAFCRSAAGIRTFVRPVTVGSWRSGRMTRGTHSFRSSRSTARAACAGSHSKGRTGSRYGRLTGPRRLSVRSRGRPRDLHAARRRHWHHRTTHAAGEGRGPRAGVVVARWQDAPVHGSGRHDVLALESHD